MAERLNSNDWDQILW